MGQGFGLRFACGEIALTGSGYEVSLVCGSTVKLRSLRSTRVPNYSIRYYTTHVTFDDNMYVRAAFSGVRKELTINRTHRT